MVYTILVHVEVSFYILDQHTHIGVILFGSRLLQHNFLLAPVSNENIPSNIVFPF